MLNVSCHVMPIPMQISAVESAWHADSGAEVGSRTGHIRTLNKSLFGTGLSPHLKYLIGGF